MTIVVTGYIIGYPLGGMTWHHLNYLAGFHELGHEVWFYEDSGQWYVPYNPVDNVVDPDPTYGIAYLRRALAALGMPERFCYHSELQNKWYGQTKPQWHDVLKRADLVLCVSGVTPWREEFRQAKRTCVIDTDPVFTQLRMRDDPDFLDYYKCFDRVATFGKLIGTKACPLPTAGLNWIGTNQPIALSHWPMVATSSQVFSTIGKWDHGPGRQFEFEGKVYQSSKGVEWMKLLKLPKRTSFRMEMAMAGVSDETAALFEGNGWHFTDPTVLSISPDSYRSFIQRQAGELTVAKQIYSGLPSGWFSDRSACFLASGKPVVTQRSGFEQWLPMGEGLFAFETIEEAAAAMAQIAGDYARHAKAARSIAQDHFDARRVLERLIADIG